MAALVGKKKRTAPCEVEKLIPEMKKLYAEGKSTREIGKILGLSGMTVYRRLSDDGKVKLQPDRTPRVRKEPKGPLSPEEIRRLRRLVGVDPETGE